MSTSSKKIDLEDIYLFCKVAECHSFTEAAILLGTTPSSISKAIARLEKKLSLKLFIRSTRAMRLTEEGISYYEVCKKSIDDILAMENQLAANVKPHGTLRISAPDSYGVTVLIPNLSPFIEQNRHNLQLEISLGNHFVNFTKEPFDLAIRIGELEETRVIAKYLHKTAFKLVASPRYLEKYGVPETIDDLSKHQCIGLHFPDRGTPIYWEFGEKYHRPPITYAIVHSHSLAARDHALLGLGITRLLDYSVQREIDNGKLIEVLPGSAPPPMNVQLVYPSNGYIPAKTRLFIDYFMKEILPLLSSGDETIDYYI